MGVHVGVSLHENRFVVDFRDVDWLDGQALVVATYFKNLAPPFQFTLYGFADTLVQLDPSTRFYHDWGSANDLGPDSWVGVMQSRGDHRRTLLGISGETETV